MTSHANDLGQTGRLAQQVTQWLKELSPPRGLNDVDQGRAF